jgi:hypothetical protein
MEPSKIFVRKYPPEKGLIFVIMPFAGKLKEVFDVVLVSCAKELKMKCFRADDKRTYTSEPLMQEIWSHIQRAEIIIADITDRNPNVMYELGLCHALWKKIILISQKIEGVPFDISHYKRRRAQKRTKTCY